jgi:polyisoprenoid-binding protein YceI
MRRLPIALAAVLFAWPALAASTNPADMPAGHWTLDASHASLIAKVKHLGVVYYAVRFDKLAGTFTWDPAHPEATHLEASVDVTSLDVGNQHSKAFAEDFLAASRYPKATFVSTAVTPAADGKSGTITGDLTLRGVTRPVTLQVSFVGVGHGFPFGTVAGFAATAEIKRSDFGSRRFLGLVGDDVSLEVDAEFEHR